MRLLASYLIEVKRRVLAPKILLERSDKLKLVTSFCNVSSKHLLKTADNCLLKTADNCL